MAKATRVCCECNKTFNIIENEYIKTKQGRYCEIKCYKDKQLKKGLSKKTVDKEVEVILEVQEQERKLVEEKHLEEVRKKQESKKREIGRTENLDRLINYLSANYNISVFPNHFYIKLASINSGTKKGMTTGIKYDELLEMFKLKQKHLNDIYEKNTRHGKEMSGIQRINYDIAVLINKYDSFLKWKERQKILESNAAIEVKEKSSEVKLDYTNISKAGKQKEEDMDISDILNDIY